MFTTGRLIFTAIFILLFVAVLIWAYRKDLKQLKIWGLKPGAVLIGLVLIMLMYYFFSRYI